MAQNKLLTEEQVLSSVIALVRHSKSLRLHIFCDLHYFYDEDGTPNNNTFFSAIVQLFDGDKLLENNTVVMVRDKRKLKRYKTKSALLNALTLDDRCSVTFRTYELDSEDL